VKEVDEDSEEARKWPALPLPESKNTATASTSQDTLPTTSAAEASTSKSASPSAAAIPPAGKRAGRRKPKVQLADLPSSSSQKTKKLTTLEKSAMDWQAHVDSHKDSELGDELEANRRGGGYLEKVQFLQRVEDRKDQALDESKSRKRRRG